MCVFSSNCINRKLISLQLVDPHYQMSVELHMLIILGPLIAINCIRNLKALAPWSTLANILTLLGLGIIVYYLLAYKKSEKELDLWGSLSTFPLFFGTTLFALTAVGVVSILINTFDDDENSHFLRLHASVEKSDCMGVHKQIYLSTRLSQLFIISGLNLASKHSYFVDYSNK